jgi:trehalose 6-phosphate synthase
MQVDANRETSSRIVVVSNRLPIAHTRERTGQVDVPAGGLASAILGALRGMPGSRWFGWSGGLASRSEHHTLSKHKIGDVEFIGLSLTQAEHRDYYSGFCNQVLWPLFHCFQGKILITLSEEETYRSVQARFARAILPQLRVGDVLWVHDYHLLLLGRELRRLGWRGRIGFFLHVPFPPHELWEILPDPLGFLDAMLDYDVVGFHVQSFLDNYVSCCRRQLGAGWDGSLLSVGARRQKADVYALGIDPSEFRPTDDSIARAKVRGELARVVRGRKLVLGVDRLDYTKGIPERLLAFERLLIQHPEWRKKVSLIQIAAPSRAAALQYRDLKARVESVLGRVNAEMADHDWVPVRYLYRTYPRKQIARFYREAAVGLVTPLRDGMNLVAMEFVAAQCSASPGVLVLSRTAGAAQELPAAVLVNPYVPSEVADGIARALSMPLEERRERHAAQLRRIMERTASDWANDFLADLRSGGATHEQLVPWKEGAKHGDVRRPSSIR